jgi:rod shape-determining protein MreC
MKKYILMILTIAVAGTFYFTDFFISNRKEASENVLLKQENQELLAQLQGIGFLGGNGQKDGDSFIRAKVFSAYPFNIKNTITVNAGSKNGVEKNMPAVLEGNIFVGRVSEVFENYSVVETFFDPSWEMSARIGESAVDGLLEGGNEPKVTLIEKNKPCETGDLVYSASKEFPYGLKIGEVARIKEDSAGVFKEAILKIPFNVNELREINILLH